MPSRQSFFFFRDIVDDGEEFDSKDDVRNLIPRMMTVRNSIQRMTMVRNLRFLLAELISVKHDYCVLSSTIELLNLSKLSNAFNGKDKGVATTVVLQQLPKELAAIIKVKGKDFVAKLPELDAYYVWTHAALIDEKVDDSSKTFRNSVTKAVVLRAFGDKLKICSSSLGSRDKLEI